MLVFAVTLALAGLAQDSVRPAPRPVAPDAYQDSGAGDIVRRARAARQRNERLVTSYSANVSQRFGVGIHALSRDRMLYHQEAVAHIEWRRDSPSRIEMQGAREAIPVASHDDRIPDDLEGVGRGLVINPAEDYLRLLGSVDTSGFSYPIRDGGENDYRFASGDTTVITLPGGHTTRLIELKVIPRRSDFRLMSGSLWFDAESYGLVRAVFKPARPFDLRRDADRDDRSDIPSWLNVGLEVKYVTIEYGLYNFRWWMMRYMAIDAVGTMGSLLGVPFRFERVYSDYQVDGGTPPPAGSTFRPAGSVRSGRSEYRARRDSAQARLDSLRALGDSLRADSVAARMVADSITRRAYLDSLRQARRECVRRARSDSAAAGRRRSDQRRAAQVQVRICYSDGNDSALVVVVPQDTMQLLHDSRLGQPILDMGDVISEGEIDQLAREIHGLGQRPWEFHPNLPHGLSALTNHLRYNRVEALSIGVEGELDFGRLKLDGLARIGIADGEPNFELGLTRPTSSGAYRLGGYRRLAAANPDVSPFSLFNSVSSFIWQHDEGEYFRTFGGELTGGATSKWIDFRLFAEHQSAASVGTQFSIAHIFNRANLFRANIAAQTADEVGASVTVRGSRIVSRRITVGGEATAEGSTGTFRFGRGALTARASIAPPGRLAFGLEASAGSTLGTVPLQSFYYIGGVPSLRGYDSGVLAGDSYWRARAEVGTQTPLARVTVFSDAGWAGSRANISNGRALWSGGIGLSFLDGLVRMDLARGFSAPKGWRFVFYLDGVL